MVKWRAVVFAANVRISASIEKIGNDTNVVPHYGDLKWGVASATARVDIDDVAIQKLKLVLAKLR